MVSILENNDKLLSISRHIIEKYRMKEPVKLQKILYILYIEYLKETDKKLFEDEFEAWVYGPIIPRLNLFIENYGFNFFEIECEDHIEKIAKLDDKNIEIFINKKIRKFLKKDLSDLVEITYWTEPTIKARKKAKKKFSKNEPSSVKIEFKDLKSYARTNLIDNSLFLFEYITLGNRQKPLFLIEQMKVKLPNFLINILIF